MFVLDSRTKTRRGKCSFLSHATHRAVGAAPVPPRLSAASRRLHAQLVALLLSVRYACLVQEQTPCGVLRLPSHPMVQRMHLSLIHI